MLNILSWNIRQGGGNRVHTIVEKVVSLSPKVVILSEWRNNERGAQIRNLMLSKGYPFHFVTHAKRDVNAVAIFSTLPVDSEIHTDADPNYAANILSIHFEVFSVCGVYLPHKKKHSLIPFITALGKQRKYIIAGDYNTGKNHIDQKGKSFWYTDELKKMEDAGYIDAFRHKQGPVEEYSWYSHQGNGYRYDHTYVHEDLIPIVKNCYYIHEWREANISDHSPMILELA